MAVDKVDCESNSALHLAVTYGHLKITYTLMMHGADATLRNNVGFTAEQIAVSEQNDSILHLFVGSPEVDQLPARVRQHQAVGRTTPVEVEAVLHREHGAAELAGLVLADLLPLPQQTTPSCGSTLGSPWPT